MLNDMFVSGLCGLTSLPFHLQWLRSFQYLHAFVYQSCAFGFGIIANCPQDDSEKSLKIG